MIWGLYLERNCFVILVIETGEEETNECFSCKDCERVSFVEELCEEGFMYDPKDKLQIRSP